MPTGRWLPAVVASVWIAAISAWAIHAGVAAAPLQQASFELRVLAPALPEAPFGLRFFSGAAKTNTSGEIITGPGDDPVRKLVGAETAGPRVGVDRFTKILFGVNYFDGRPDPGTHGRTSHLSADDIEALSMYLKSLQK